MIAVTSRANGDSVMEDCLVSEDSKEWQKNVIQFMKNSFVKYGSDNQTVGTWAPGGVSVMPDN